jgi:hypothetical protein
MEHAIRVAANPVCAATNLICPVWHTNRIATKRDPFCKSTNPHFTGRNPASCERAGTGANTLDLTKNSFLSNGNLTGEFRGTVTGYGSVKMIYVNDTGG